MHNPKPKINKAMAMMIDVTIFKGVTPEPGVVSGEVKLTVVLDLISVLFMVELIAMLTCDSG